MNVLVLGAAGQLGSEIKALHRSSKYHFVFTDKDELDITSPSSLEAYLQSHPTELIINCSAYTLVDKAEIEAEAAELVNHHSVSTLARLALKYNIWLVHISTDYVFDGNSSTPYSEEATPKPLNTYGRSKLVGEKAIIASGCRYTIIRTAWLYSSYGRNFVQTMLQLQSERSSLQVVYDQIGSPTYARDLVHCILSLISKGWPKTSEVYHYTNEGVASWYDFAVAIAELSGSQCQIEPCNSSEYPTLAPRPKYSVLDKGKIRATLSKPIRHWRMALAECLTEILNP